MNRGAGMSEFLSGLSGSCARHCLELHDLMMFDFDCPNAWVIALGRPIVLMRLSVDLAAEISPGEAN